MRRLNTVIEALQATVAGIILLKFSRWLSTVAIALQGAAAGAMALNAAITGFGILALGSLAYLFKLNRDTLKLEESTRKMEQALLDMGGAAGEAARRTEIAMLQMKRSQMRTTDQIISDIAKIQLERKALAEDEFAPLLRSQADLDRQKRQDQELTALREELALVEKLKRREDELIIKKVQFGNNATLSYNKAKQAAESYANAALGFATQVPVMAERPTAAGQPGAMSTGQSEQVKQATQVIEQQSKAFWGVKDAVSSTNEDFKKHLVHNQSLVDTAATSLQQERKRNELLLEHGGNLQTANREMAIWLEQQKLDNYGREESAEKIRAQMEETQKLKDANKELSEAYTEEQRRVQQETEAYQRSQEQWTNSLSYAFKDAIMNSKNLGDALSNLASRVQSLLVNKALDSLLGGLLGGMFAKGAAFKAGGVTAFASGGVVGSPTMFPMSNNRTGLMGEAGPEAIMPLTRTSSGDLGVRAVGGSNTVVAPVRLYTACWRWH